MSDAFDNNPPQSKQPGDLIAGDLTGKIIRAFYVTYDILGYGFLESVYVTALQYELSSMGVESEREAAIDVPYKSIRAGHFRADLLAEKTVIIEVKSTELLERSTRRKVHNYLNGTAIEVALLLHYGPKASFERFVLSNSHKPPRTGR